MKILTNVLMSEVYSHLYVWDQNNKFSLILACGMLSSRSH